jgi:Ca2+-binding RTX toxin-like protein
MATVRGTNGDDNLTPRTTDRRDVVYGGGGNDLIDGKGGDDTIDGEAGNDNLSGGAGRDLVFGGVGNDSINGGAGSDRLFGEAGDDTFVFAAGDGTDTIYDFASGEDIRFVGFGNLAAVTAAADETSSGLQFNFDGNSLLVIGVNEISDIDILIA